MATIVLGAAGLLGSCFVREYPVIGLTRRDCDITSNKQLHDVLTQIKPDTIINCAGIVPKNTTSPEQLFLVNSVAPRFIAEIATRIGAKFVQISTNCVFNGAVGGYDEFVLPYPSDLYGMSKLFGEIGTDPHVTVRTSFVGLPDAPGRGLLAWAAKQTGDVIGYDQYLWNGVTTKELVHTIMDKIVPDNVSGIVHVYGETVTKADLLEQAAEVFGWGYKVIDESEAATGEVHSFNRTLKSLYNYHTDKTLRQMLEELQDDNLRT